MVADDPAATVRKLKAETGRGIWLVGGSTLAGALYEEIDEIVVKINPVASGTGIPLFTGRSQVLRRRFAVREHTMLDSGVVIITYAAR